VSKSFDSRIKKTVLSLVFPILFLSSFSLSGCAPVDQDVDGKAVGTVTLPSQTTTTDAPKSDLLQETKPESQEGTEPESQEGTEPEPQETTEPESNTSLDPAVESPEVTEQKAGGGSNRWVQLILIVVIIIILSWLLINFLGKKSNRSAPVDGSVKRRSNEDDLRRASSNANPPPHGSVPKTDDLRMGSESRRTMQPTKEPQPPSVVAKVERPVLSTTSAPSATEVQLSNTPTADNGLISSAPGGFEPVSVKARIEVEEKQIVETQERLKIQPPQIGEPSSFALYDWWDKDREWCKVSPLGMSSDVVCDIGTFGTIAIAATSLRGHKHKVSGEPCQDAFSLRATQSLSGQKFVVAVLCDGMSSAKHSEYGARRTSQLLALSLAAMVEDQEEITEQRVKSVLPEIFEYCKRNLMPQKRNQFGAPGILPKEAVESDFFTTLTFLIVPASLGDNETLKSIVIGSIGDSAVFVLNNANSTWEETVKVGTSSEILDPATNAFPATFDAHVSSIAVESSGLVIATSDGVGNFLNVRGKQTSLGTYLAKQWGKPVNLPTFINDVGFDLKSADDDRTVIAIWLSRS